MARDIVICCDGTWNSPQQTDRERVVPSNVVKMTRGVSLEHPELLYYDRGVGTSRGDRFTGGALGVGLSENIVQAYRFLAQRHMANDRIFMFGFSRGAYTVRSLAGWIGRCGLASPDEALMARAYELYRQANDEEGRNRAADFKARQRTVPIHFLGVWDTVGALGVPALSRLGLLRKLARKVTRKSALAHGFHDETLGDEVIHACQALSIDERRGPFTPSLWRTTPGQERTGVEQVWFAGVHSNVGGGYVDAGLSDHAFMWMVEKAREAGMRFDPLYLQKRVDPNCHGELRNSMSVAYRVFPDGERTIGAPTTLNERIHLSAINRMDHPTNAYAPDNLRNGCDRGVPIAEEGIKLTATIRSHGAWSTSPI